MALTSAPTPVQTEASPAPRRTTASGPVRRVPRNPRRWPNAALLAGALLSALGSLHVVLLDLSWWGVGSLFAVIVLVAAAIARGFLRSRLLPTVIAAATALVALTIGYAADTALLGVIPTPASFARFTQLTAVGLDSIAQQSVPATPELSIVFLIGVLMAISALFADLVVAFRRPGVAFLPLAVILGVPTIVSPGLSDAFWYILTAVCFLAILRIGARPSAVRTTVFAGAIIIATSLVIPFIVPFVDNEDAPTTSGIASGINPLINLGEDLRRAEVVTALRYSTSNTDGAYLRLATLENFNGRAWSPNTVTATGDNNIDKFPNPPGLTSPIARNELWVDVQVHDISGRWLPLPYPTSSVTGLEGDWAWEESGLTARSATTGVRDQQYRAHFLDIDPTLEQLEAVRPAAQGSVNRYLELPTDMPPIIAETAAQVAGGQASAYDRALALQNYFRNGDFTYSEEAPVAGNYDGTSADIIARFLDVKKGYCIHYASAMAVMARTLGLPARIAVGFQPGDKSFERGETSYTVQSDDLHAWPEIYFTGIGWLRFEPTPGRGSVPQYGVTAVDDPTTPQNEATPTATATPGASVPNKLEEDQTQASGSLADRAANPAGPIALTVVVLLLLIAITPAVVRSVIRMRRYRAMTRGTDAATAAWAELRDTAHDYGWSAPESETPRAFEERLSIVLVRDRAQLARLRGSVESAAYGRAGSGVISVDELRGVRRAIARATPFWERIRIALLPPSLVARVRGEDD